MSAATGVVATTTKNESAGGSGSGSGDGSEQGGSDVFAAFDMPSKLPPPASPVAAKSGDTKQKAKRRKRKQRKPIHIPLIHTLPADKELREREQRVAAWINTMKAQPLQKYIDFGFESVLKNERELGLLSRIFGGGESASAGADGNGNGNSTSNGQTPPTGDERKSASNAGSGGSGSSGTGSSHSLLSDTPAVGAPKQIVPPPERFWMQDEKCKTCYDCGVEFHFYRRKQYVVCRVVLRLCCIYFRMRHHSL